MDDRIFYNELSSQIDFTFISVNDMNRELNSDELDDTKFWYSIQSFLVSVANVSKILYPSKTSKETNHKRAKRLRMVLNLPDESILAKKTLRNCFEHYDEKLDDFLKSNNGIYIGRAIADIGDVVVDGEITGFYMRHYNPSTNVLSFKGFKYNLQDVINEIVLLKKKIEEI